MSDLTISVFLTVPLTMLTFINGIAFSIPLKMYGHQTATFLQFE